jgi:hypothetical protein
MNRLNIVTAGKNKLIKIKLYTDPDNFDEIFTITDGKGNYPLSNDNAIFWTDKRGVNDLNLDGNPDKLYKGKPFLQVVEVDGKLGVWDTNLFKKKLGPYKNMDALIDDVYGYGEGGALGNDLKYLDFEYKPDIEPDFDEW